jgi:hypothetical protein
VLAVRRLVSGFLQFFFEDKGVSDWASQRLGVTATHKASGVLRLFRPLAVAVVVDDVQRQLQWEGSGSEDWHDGPGVERAFTVVQARPCKRRYGGRSPHANAL